jgi:hypothetical protein
MMVRKLILSALILCSILLCGCSAVPTRTMEVTAYTASGEDNGYTRGRWRYLKINQWNRYVNYGSRKGEKYTGLTANGTRLRQYDPGLFHPSTILRPWNLLIRLARVRYLVFTYDEPGPPFEIKHGLISFNTLVSPTKAAPRIVMLPVRFFMIPGLFRPRRGTIAADTDYYPFETVLKVSGYGTGIVEDRGGAIKGPERLDVFYNWTWAANQWGRENVKVKIYYPDGVAP